MMIERIETAAERLLAEANVRAVPVPIEDVARHLRISISRAPSSDFSGLLIRKEDRALIGVNSSEAPVRQRFTIAHEIGHYILHPRKDAFVDFRKDRAATELKPPRERQADMFAAALLMPRSQLLKDVRKLAKDGVTETITDTLAVRYGVSEEAMGIRLVNLLR
jgi:Zn-dependent peptidase ImmA (M78 family)